MKIILKILKLIQIGTHLTDRNQIYTLLFLSKHQTTTRQQQNRNQLTKFSEHVWFLYSNTVFCV